ncbi:uncharacterized protein EDB91DRAFT_1086747 [Suillus paluster]|uniref:uncharacterized protein n=1 Tax=Suillus paluster TaxID=48578 RepID=UPI001B8834EB|nr:uncharacterized protein EDB91DRAFT_1086747 [Suillus paluster]KAG1726515.1 hypothetical protein EDB91DRAFT_1086747 [Suillus paluster]
MFTSQKLNEANEGISVFLCWFLKTNTPQIFLLDDCWKLPAFIAEHQQDLTAEYVHLSASQKEQLRHHVLNLRKNRIKIVRSNPKALQKQVNAMFESMEQEWQNITARTGVEGFYVAVCGDVEHFHESNIFYTPKAKSFIKEITHLDPKRFALKFESWVMGNFGKRSMSNQYSRGSQCQDAINTKNNLLKKKINMNYDNYENKIVEKHRIILEGWTYRQVQNPGKIGHREDLVTLLNALVNGRCVWVKLSEQNLEQRMESNRERAKNGESIYKPRKTMKKNPPGAAKSAAVIEDSDVSQDESEEEVEGEMQSVQDHGAAVEE